MAADTLNFFSEEGGPGTSLGTVLGVLGALHFGTLGARKGLAKLKNFRRGITKPVSELKSYSKYADDVARGAFGNDIASRRSAFNNVMAEASANRNYLRQDFLDGLAREGMLINSLEGMSGKANWKSFIPKSPLQALGLGTGLSIAANAPSILKSAFGGDNNNYRASSRPIIVG